MLLIVLTGDDDVVAYEPRSLLARDEAEDDRRKEVRKDLGEKREVMDWRREDCMLEDSLIQLLVYSFLGGGERRWAAERVDGSVRDVGTFFDETTSKTPRSLAYEYAI